MKAMILAAGFGTRLLPYTERTPKPLFTIAGRPLLDIHIERLQRCGCRAVIVNTHHLHDQIEAFLRQQDYPIPVEISREAEILGTGGAVKKAAHFWGNQPFMVINGDIVSDIDLGRVYQFHLDHAHAVTMVLHDYAEFNQVNVDGGDFVHGFHEQPHNAAWRRLAFTGIQVLDPAVLDQIPAEGFADSIDVYRRLITKGRKVKAFVSQDHYWRDIGTPSSYRNTVFETMAPDAFRQAFPASGPIPFSRGDIRRTRLAGDGSDRSWFRLSAGRHSLIMADHGIRNGTGTCEAEAFVAIGSHLRRNKLPVPQIFGHDVFAGQVFLEDLGDKHLQQFIQQAQSLRHTADAYRRVIDHLLDLSLQGAQGFDPAWTYQTPHYSKDVILEKECRYFTEAFLRGYLHREVRYEDLQGEFNILADRALASAFTGFMHRDLQSRNIMVREGRFYFIDFQGGRLGPLQYDLASLLIDPYVQLPFALRDELAAYCTDRLASRSTLNRKKFRAGYNYCAVTRNLQMLGAFGFLSRVKQKTYFEAFIPAAMDSLRHNLAALGRAELPQLTSIVEGLTIESKSGG